MDRDGLFGSDYAAAKVAGNIDSISFVIALGHDLKGLMHYFNLGFDLHVPLSKLLGDFD